MNIFFFSLAITSLLIPHSAARGGNDVLFDYSHHDGIPIQHDPPPSINPNDYLNIWPYPNDITFGSSVLFIDPNNFQFKPVGVASQSKILNQALVRYFSLMFAWGAPKDVPQPQLSAVTVIVNSADETLSLTMDESYSLRIDVTGEAQITAPEVWGAMHALETLSQIVEWNHTISNYNVLHAPYMIVDGPRFPWRGLMIDTARNFLSVDTILRTIDALAFNKMNVLHWHASDAESMPVESRLFPNLALKGAFTEMGIYSQDEIKIIIQYGKSRGVRVIPEFDMPGHNYAYGLGVPNLIVDCPLSHPVETQSFAASFDPISDNVYNFLTSFLGEMSTLFPDEVLHIGGDEVFYECWNQTQSIRDYMALHNLTLKDLYVMFEKRAHDIVLANGKVPMTWDDAFTSARSVLPQNAIVQVWRGYDTLTEAIQDGFRAVLSAFYYLNAGFDLGGQQVQWNDIYAKDPMPPGLTPEQQELMLGAEACIWAEEVNDNNIDQRVWFRANVFSERLWSFNTSSSADVQVRVIKQDCRLMQRGIACTPYENRDLFPRRDLRRACDPLFIPQKPNLRQL